MKHYNMEQHINAMANAIHVLEYLPVTVMGSNRLANTASVCACTVATNTAKLTKNRNIFACINIRLPLVVMGN